MNRPSTVPKAIIFSSDKIDEQTNLETELRSMLLYWLGIERFCRFWKEIMAIFPSLEPIRRYGNEKLVVMVLAGNLNSALIKELFIA